MRPAPHDFSQPIPISEFLTSEGFADAAERAREVLEEAGLTNPRKQRLSLAKLDRASLVLREKLGRICHACSIAHPYALCGREMVAVKQFHCEVCAGSNNRRAAQSAIRKLKEAGVRHVLVVGGWPRRLADLRQSLDDPALELRCVDGSSGVRPIASIEADLNWADVLVIWRKTPLNHSFSERYTTTAREAKFSTPIFTAEGGVQAFCHQLERHASARLDRNSETSTPKRSAATKTWS
jgi:hypothetical protein